MQKIAIAIIIMLLGSTLHAQQSWQWGKRGGTPQNAPNSNERNEGELEMVTDSRGNVYVLAFVDRSSLANIDGYISTNPDNQLSLSKWSCDGTHQWTRFMGGNGKISTIPASLAIDSLGGLYFTGTMRTTPSGPGASGDVYFEGGGPILTNTPKMWYIAKYDTAGVFQWLKMPQADTVTIVNGTAIQSRPIGLDAAPNGNIYILAHLAPGIFSNAYVSDSLNSFQLMRYDKDGNFLDAKPVDMSVSINASNMPDLVNISLSATGFARDHNLGNFYLSGSYYSDYGSLTFGTTQITAVSAVNNCPLYLAAFDSLGNSLWAEQSSPPSATNPMYSRPRIDAAGNVYICGGAISGTGSFMGHTFINSYITGIGGVQFVLSIDNSGNLRWAKNSANPPFLTYLRGLSYSNGVVAVSDGWETFHTWGADTLSNSYGCAFVRFNANNGNQISNMDTFSISYAPNFAVYDIAADNNGSFYLGGSFPNQIFLPNDTLTKLGGTVDFFVIKWGAANCNCTVPVSDFNYNTTSTNSTVSFTYTGSTPVDSVHWDFGDGSFGSGLSINHTYTANGTYGVTAKAYNSCGMAIQYKEITVSTTGIKGNNIASAVSIYPNPSTQSIIIEGAGIGTSLEFINSLGQRVISGSITAEKQAVDVSSLSNGLYIIHFTTKEGSRGSVKMLKE